MLGEFMLDLKPWKWLCQTQLRAMWIAFSGHFQLDSSFNLPISLSQRACDPSSQVVEGNHYQRLMVAPIPPSNPQKSTDSGHGHPPRRVNDRTKRGYPPVLQPFTKMGIPFIPKKCDSTMVEFMVAYQLASCHIPKICWSMRSHPVIMPGYWLNICQITLKPPTSNTLDAAHIP